MLETIYTSRKKLKAVRKCWLHDPINKYLAMRVANGYAKNTIGGDAYWLLRFAAFSRKRRVRTMTALPDLVAPFVDTLRGPTGSQQARRRIGQFLFYLRKEGLIRAPRVPTARFFRCISEYERFLLEERGISNNTIAGIKVYCAKFLKYVRTTGTAKLRLLKRQTVQDFIIAEGRRYCRKTMIRHCSILRKFLSYLYCCRRLPRDFSAVVVTPRTYRHERCPRYLTRPEIEKLISAVDRKTAIGKRNYAVLQLLATYGLRGIEVVRLSLDDVNWESGSLHICGRKNGRSSVYPMAASVAEALASYLKEGRPESGYREVFLTHTAPFRPVQTVAIRHIVKKYLRQSGLDTRGAGAHTLRYSCAQRLFEEEFSIKVIGDYLGHRELETTRRYVKIDVNNLREVALNDGEELL